MSNVQQNTPQEVNYLVDWLYGKENDPTYGAAARFIRDQVNKRPAVGFSDGNGHPDARWPNFDAMFTHARYCRINGSTVIEDQLTAAIAAFRAG